MARNYILSDIVLSLRTTLYPKWSLAVCAARSSADPGPTQEPPTPLSLQVNDKASSVLQTSLSVAALRFDS